ncbi:hypothetical protein VCR8J2_190840 [Vibrio coralliirubri]|nr:hypothetical protein VCR8J2_190840 [Vibrio coralliirubri]
MYKNKECYVCMVVLTGKRIETPESRSIIRNLVSNDVVAVQFERLCQ